MPKSSQGKQGMQRGKGLADYIIQGAPGGYVWDLEDISLPGQKEKILCLPILTLLQQHPQMKNMGIMGVKSTAVNTLP